MQVRNFVQDHIDWCSDVNHALEDFEDDDVGMEGIGRQIGGAVKDHVTYKHLRDVLKIGGWTGWDIDRIKSGMDKMEKAIHKYVDSNIHSHELKGLDVPMEALSSTMAWRGVNISSVMLIDDKMEKGLMKSIEDDLDLPISTKDMVSELITPDKALKIVKGEIKKFEDYKDMFSKAVKNAKAILDASVDEKGKLKKAIYNNHFIGLNGLAVLAGQIRSSIRRAI